MVTIEQSRRRLHRELTDVMGEERATMLVDELPPVDWADLATKRDLQDEIAGVRREVNELRIATTRDIEELRTSTTYEITQLRTSTTRDIEELRTSTAYEITQLRTSTTRDIEELRTSTTRDIEELRTRDIAELRAEMNTKFALVHKEFELIHGTMVTKAEMHREMRSLATTVFFGNAALAGVVAFLTSVLN